MGIFILLFWYQCLAYVVLKPRIASLKLLECIKVGCQNIVRMYIVMVSSISGSAYKNITSGTRNEAQ